MGAGKSSVGRMLARRLGFSFVETDDMITAREGISIPRIFAEKGEPYFRALEAEVLKSLGRKRGHVISTGGGFPCREGAMEVLKTLGTVVWLKGEFETLHRRARHSGGRPMLAGRDKAGLRELLGKREASYSQAHIVVDTTGRGIEEVVSSILLTLRKHGNRSQKA